jgi:SMI1 / KNR4 family (SUKH-1)
MKDRTDFQKIYKSLVKKHLARDWQTKDGIPEEDILKIEEKLGFGLPTALREYYLTVGNLGELNKMHNLLVDLSELPHILFDFKNQPEALFYDIDANWRSQEDFLIFMEENQGVVYWALKTESINQTDPTVWQIVNNSQPEFYSEEKTFSEFIVEMFDWQFEEINL